MAACTAVAQYDIDVKCWRDEAFLGVISFAGSEDDVQHLECYEPKKIAIQCDRATIQKIEGETTCTTKDKKTIRIIEYAPSINEVRTIYPNAMK